MPSIRLSEGSPEERNLVRNLSRTWHLLAGAEVELKAAYEEMQQLYQPAESLRKEFSKLQ
jgi:hypothetical protein